jgi:aspartate-semialdehyde dehydrogenase
MSYKVAVVGATGLVGTTMIKVLQERKFPVTQLIPVASARSIGKKVAFNSEEVEIVTVKSALEMKPAIALFSAGAAVAKESASLFAEIGCVVIDNSSAFRMEEDIKLIVPEINGDSLQRSDKIISNPNCSTIQLVMILAPLHAQYGIKRVVISTYQSVSGTGSKALLQLNYERHDVEAEKAYPYPIDKNCLPHCDDFTENGYTKEEVKLVNETRKILGDSSLRITATAVRVPVTSAHSESVNIEFSKPFDIDEVRSILNSTDGVIVSDDVAANVYPMPLDAEGKDEVFVGRIRRDESNENSLNCWIVADNLRKGAATNAVQIAERLLEKNIL